MDQIIECPICAWTYEPDVSKHYASNQRERTFELHLQSHDHHDWLPVLMRYKNLAEKKLHVEKLVQERYNL